MTHPVLVAVEAVDAALKSVADANPTFLTTAEKAAALVEVSGLQARLGELRLRLLAAAGDVAEEYGDRSPAAWLARATRCRRETARAEERLATALDRRWSVLAAGVREGRVGLDQAATITGCLDDLATRPAAGLVDPETLAAAEAHLVDQAEVFGPEELARLGRRILDVVAPQVAEQVEARRLADLEAHAAHRTRLTLRRTGDGTTRLTGLLPDTTATRLATYLAAFANPRTHPAGLPEPDDNLGPTGGEPADPAVPTDRLPYPRRLGQAFCQLLETLDPTRLPLHGGDATTLVVTLDHETLLTGLGAADLLDTAGDPVPGEDPTGGRIAAAQARRLACTARLLPAVLAGPSEVLDLGRARRLFTPAQRRALLLRDRTCRAAGCDIPGTWAEAHHWTPWTRGGPTDLDNAVLLCAHHHHRAHDPTWTSHRLPDGDVRFHRRT